MKLPSSSHFAVIDQPAAGVVRLVFMTKSGKPSSKGVVWEACSVCFINSQGKQAPPIVGGVCAWCGRRVAGTELDVETREVRQPEARA